MFRAAPRQLFRASFVPRMALRTYSKGTVEEIHDLSQLAKLVGQKDKLAVVDFYANWCGPCKALEPIFNALALKVPEVNFARVDVDAAQDVAQEYAITAMPTCLFFKNGEKIETIIGANPPKLVQLIETHSGTKLK